MRVAPQSLIRYPGGQIVSFDIDLALAIIKAPEGDEKGLIAYCPEAFAPESREFLPRLIV